MKGKLPGFMASLLGKKDAAQQNAAEEGVIHFWDDTEAPAYQIILTDVREANRSYRHVIDRSLLIGFSNEMDICVNYDRSVSRRHCEILRQGDLFFIINHSRTNGTRLNQVSIVDKTPLSDGDLITMGRVAMRLQIDG